MDNRMNERAVIGSILISPECADVVREKLRPEHMSDPLCRTALEAAYALKTEGVPLDTLTIIDRIKTEFPNCDNDIVSIMQTTPTANNVVAYCNLVKQNCYRNRLKDIAEDMAFAASTTEDWAAIADRFMNTVKSMTDEETNGIKTGLESFTDFATFYDDAQENPGKAFCTTGYKDLDAILGGGLFRSGLYIIGARPGMGKTTLAVNLAENMVAAGKAVLFVSLEMSDTQIAAKRISKETGFNYSAIISGKISRQNNPKIYEACQKLGDRPFFISDRSGLNIGDISALAYQVPDLQCIVIDYLGLIRSMTPETPRPRYEEITEISGQLKGLAKRLNIPVIVLCQLNRKNTNRKDKTPLLQDLRDSGAIEQDADAVIFLHRPDYYEGKTESRAEIIKLIVAKNRHAGSGIIEMNWKGTSGQITAIDYWQRKEEDNDYN